MNFHKINENSVIKKLHSWEFYRYNLDSWEQIDKMVMTAKQYGADFVFIGALTLFGNGDADCKTLYYKFLEKHYPELVPKYKGL
ncbi:MAG: hypothetical protein COS36_02365 [Candidatus Altarchaeum sp. CG03_land_8_20_14_0_80_32_618]|nr:MAG: hypothetical protein COS36_02365 [Candidatus Altarchaeum sp. CG03_land_8_20_14_0_80_32_618]